MGFTRCISSFIVLLKALPLKSLAPLCWAFLYLTLMNILIVRFYQIDTINASAMLKSKIKEKYYETSLDTTRSNSNEIWFRSNNVRNEQVISKLYIKGLRSLFCCAKALNRVSLIIWEHPAYHDCPSRRIHDR